MGHHDSDSPSDAEDTPVPHKRQHIATERVDEHETPFTLCPGGILGGDANHGNQITTSEDEKLNPYGDWDKHCNVNGDYCNEVRRSPILNCNKNCIAQESKDDGENDRELLNLNDSKKSWVDVKDESIVQHETSECCDTGTMNQLSYQFSSNSADDRLVMHRISSVKNRAKTPSNGDVKKRLKPQLLSNASPSSVTQLSSNFNNAREAALDHTVAKDGMNRPFSLTSFKELEPLLFNKLEKHLFKAKRRQQLELRFWDPSGDQNERVPIEVSQGPWMNDRYRYPQSTVDQYQQKFLDREITRNRTDESNDENQEDEIILLAPIPSILKDHVCIEELEAAFDVLESKLITKMESINSLHETGLIKAEFNSLEKKAGRYWLNFSKHFFLHTRWFMFDRHCRELCRIFHLCEVAQILTDEIKVMSGQCDTFDARLETVRFVHGLRVSAKHF